MTWVNRLIKSVPLTGISVELVKFDTQKIMTPEISGIEYQQGKLFGYEVREYLLEKWQRKCAYCGSKNLPLEVEHIQPKSKGGTNRISNLTLACQPCNQAKGNQDIRDFLSGKTYLLNQILKQSKQPLKEATAVNTTRWKLYNYLKETGLPIEIGSGGLTKFNRLKLGLEKTHWLDAACVDKSTPDNLTIKVTKPLLIRAEGWGNREMVQKNKYGFPRVNKKGRQAIKSRSPIQFGFRTGDLVRAIVPTGKHEGTHIGKVTVRVSGAFDLKVGSLKRQSIRWKYCQALQKKDGYSYSFPA